MSCRDKNKNETTIQIGDKMSLLSVMARHKGGMLDLEDSE
jgi:hypothetical protein